MENDNYSEKVRQQIEQYVNTENIHDLPEIFHIWSHNFILPGLVNVFNAQSIADFYRKALMESISGVELTAKILSVGCGDGSVEIEIAKSLLANKYNNFKFTCLDLSPVLIERFADKVRSEGLTEFLTPLAADLNGESDLGKFNMIMANHSLHHMVDLENLFSAIESALEPKGIFATCDMIGRNGHMRWAETEAVLQAFWPTLSERQRFHHQLQRFDENKFQDFDCSDDGFEGIRAQDILGLILHRFRPYKFFGYGGFIDVLVDRGYGPGYDETDEKDKNFIIAMSKLNDMMLDAGMVKPTTMMAYFTLDDRGEHFYRERRAGNSVRDPLRNPSWVRHYET